MLTDSQKTELEEALSDWQLEKRSASSVLDLYHSMTSHINSREAMGDSLFPNLLKMLWRMTK